MAKKKITFSPDPKVNLDAESVNRYEVAKDRTPSDGVLDYDYPEGIAIEWVKKNPNATHLIYTDVDGKKQSKPLKCKTEAGKVQEVLEWMKTVNRLTDVNGNDCALPYLHIQPRWNLVMPEGYALGTPKQSRIKASECKTCDMPPPAPGKQADIKPIELPPALDIPKGGGGGRGGLPRVEQPIGVRAPFYAASGNLGANGRHSEQQDVQNYLLQLGLKPNQPHTAARGSNPRSNGIHTIGDGLAALGKSLPFIPVSVPVASMQVTLAFIGLDTNILPGTAPRREGSDGSAQDKAESWGGLNVTPWVTEKTILDATKLYGLGIEHKPDGRLIDVVDGKDGKKVPASEFNNNELFTIPGRGAYTPSVTGNQTREETGEFPTFLPLQRAPSAPLAVPLNNYAVAAYVDQSFVAPNIIKSLHEVTTAPTQENVQRLVSLYNLRQNLTGISNYPVNADVSKEFPKETAARDMMLLNPAERIAYARQRVLDMVKEKGIDIAKLDLNQIAQVRTISKAEMRANLVEYYDTMAKGEKESQFRSIYNRVMGADAEYNKDDDAARKAVAEKFVDTLPYLQTYPENGFVRKDMEKFYLSPREKFTPVERRELRPKTLIAADAPVLKDGMEAIAGNEDNVRLLLQRSGGNSQFAQVFGLSDLYSIQAKTDHRETRGESAIQNLSRESAIAEIGKRGYSKELMESQFTDAYSDDRLRDMAAIQSSLAKSADDADILKLRAGDLRHMATDGREGSEVGGGAHAKALLHALAHEEGNKTLIDIMDNNKKKYPATEAEQKNEALLHAVVSSLDDVTQQHLGVTHSKLAELVEQRSKASAQAGKPQATPDKIEEAKKVLAAAGVTSAAHERVKSSVAETGKAEVETVTPAPGVVTDTAAARALAQAIDSRVSVQDTNLIANSLSDKHLAPLLLKDLAKKDPNFMMAAILKSHYDNPEMQQSTLDFLREKGAEGGFIEGFLKGRIGRSTPFHAFANDLEALFAAQKAQDATAVTALTAKVSAFLGDPKNSKVTNALFATMTASHNGEPSPNAKFLTITLLDALQSAQTDPTVNPLAGSNLNAKDLQALVFPVAAEVDPANTKGLSEQAQKVIKEHQMTHSMILPVIGWAKHKPDGPGTPNDPLKPGDPKICSAEPCIAPPAPTPPVTIPPPTSPPPRGPR